MKEKDFSYNIIDTSELRRRAEKVVMAKAVESPKEVRGLSPDEARETLHELLVHQIQLEMQNEELRNAQVKLQESTEKYLDLYNKSPVGYCTIDEKGIILASNSTADKLLGVASGKLVNQRLSSFILSDDQDVLYLHRRHLFITGDPKTSELRMKRKDGTLFWAQLESTADKDKGLAICRTVISDISERKRVDDALRDANWRLKNIIEGAHAGTWEWNIQTGKIIVNERWAGIVGYALDELEPITIKTWEMLVQPDDLKRANEIQEKYFAGEISFYDSESRMMHKDGHWVWVRSRGSVMTKTGDGKPLLMFGTHVDITDRKLAEEALLDSKRRLESIIEGARIGTWEWNVQTGELTFNEKWAEIVGYTIEELAPISIKTWETLVHPDDKEEALRQERKHLSGELPYYDNEYRMKHKDGHWVWIRSRGKVLTFTEDGKPLKEYGTCNDITDRKLAVEALKLRESHLTAIIENQPGLIWLKDLEGRFLVVNTEFAKSCGKNTPEEVVGLTDLDICPIDMAQRHMNVESEVIKQKIPLRVEESVFDHENIKWYETFRRPIFDKNKEVIGTTGFKFFQGGNY